MTNQDNDERKFLHDIASPLGTAIFMLEVVMEDLRNNPNANGQQIQHTEQIKTALDRIKKMLIDRREAVIAQGAPRKE